MHEKLYSVRKNRGDAAKDVSFLLSHKETIDVHVKRGDVGIYVYYTDVE